MTVDLALGACVLALMALIVWLDQPPRPPRGQKEKDRS